MLQAGSPLVEPLMCSQFSEPENCLLNQSHYRSALKNLHRGNYLLPDWCRFRKHQKCLESFHCKFLPKKVLGRKFDFSFCGNLNFKSGITGVLFFVVYCKQKAEKCMRLTHILNYWNSPLTRLQLMLMFARAEG